MMKPESTLIGTSSLSFNAVPVDIIDRRVRVGVVERIVIEDIGAVAIGINMVVEAGEPNRLA